jgi:hypothetical protein
VRTLPEELYALTAYLGGIEDAARALDVSTDLIDRALHHMPDMSETLSRRDEADLDSAIVNFTTEAGIESGEVVDYLIEYDGGEAARNLFFNLTETQSDFILQNIGDKVAKFQDMINAFEADEYNITDIEDSEFWDWFRELYEE